MGVRVIISSDAHSTDSLDYVQLGVAQSRRGWLAKSDVLNSLDVLGLRQSLRRAGQRALQDPE
jgi:DNA polymerase (family 10)